MMVFGSFHIISAGSMVYVGQISYTSNPDANGPASFGIICTNYDMYNIYIKLHTQSTSY